MSPIVKGTLVTFVISLIIGVFSEIWVSRYNDGYKDGFGIGVNNSCKEKSRE